MRFVPGRKKDFVDLAFWLQKFSFEEMMGLYALEISIRRPEHCSFADYNFENLEKSMDPVMWIKPSPIKTIKGVEKKALEYGKSLLNKKEKKKVSEIFTTCQSLASN